ncbi:MAG: polysaccharide pyruvyl transferase family protein, partial [Candidatus Thiodiazotropha sp.]
FMQAYALKKTLESFGCSVEFCDFVDGQKVHLGSKVKKNTYLNKIIKIPEIIKAPNKYLSKIIFNKKRNKVFTKKTWPILGVDECPNLNYEADLIIIGSDEVFNYTQNHAFGYVPELFGHNLSANVLASYAASAGYTDIVDIVQDDMENEIRKGLANFTCISVRDENTKKIIDKYSKHNPEIVLDPTLIYDFTNDYDELEVLNCIGDYLLIYAYADRLDDDLSIKKIKKYAKSRLLKLVSIGFFHGWCDYNIVVTPFEMLSVFKKSTAVITDTFHGTIFSIITKKKFISYIRQNNVKGSNYNKLQYLLSQLNLESRIYDERKPLSEQISIEIDYNNVKITLGHLKEKSIAYLYNIIKYTKK